MATWTGEQPLEAQYQKYTKDYNRACAGLQRFELRTWPLTNQRAGKAGGSQM